MTETSAGDLQRAMRAQIPLTEAMAIEVDSYTGDSLTLSAPLERNLNHKQTAFGGSLYSVAVLSGWGLLWLKLKERGLHGNVVITKSSTRFDAPVEGRLSATCRIENDRLERFYAALERMGKARIPLEATVFSDGQKAGRFNGVYAVL